MKLKLLTTVTLLLSTINTVNATLPAPNGYSSWQEYWDEISSYLSSLPRPRFSDQRLKNKIEHLRIDPKWFDNLHPYTFTWIGSNRDSIGFIAQDLERVDSRLVVQGEGGTPCTVEDKRGCKRIDPAGIIAILTAEVKTLRAEVDALKSDQRVGY